MAGRQSSLEVNANGQEIDAINFHKGGVTTTSEKSNVLSPAKIHATAKQLIYGIPLSIHTVHFFYAPPSNSYLYLWIESGPQALRKV